MSLTFVNVTVPRHSIRPISSSKSETREDAWEHSPVFLGQAGALPSINILVRCVGSVCLDRPQHEATPPLLTWVLLHHVGKHGRHGV